MPGIGFILMYFFLVAVSQAVLDKSYSDTFEDIITEDVWTDRNEDLFDLRNSNVQGRAITNDQECSCTYDYSNGFVKARLGHRLLEKGDSIMRGETVSFECRYVNTVLTWENGLRFYGRANMTCNTCEKWQKQHLPTCRSAQQVDVVLSQEDDLAVLSGGTVQLQTGQSYQFSCNNIWKQPEWVYPEINGVSVKKVEHSEERETIFVSYLEITDTDIRHSGIYECFSRSPSGHQTLSTVLHIEVVRKPAFAVESRGTTSTSPETGVSPTESTTSTTRKLSDDENNGECSCKYDPPDRSAIAFASSGGKRLQKNDTIRRGDTVYFSCNRREILSWENGLRYQSRALMTCSKCEVWTPTDLPTCIFRDSRRGILSSEKELSFLPGGILQMREGESHNITCISIQGQPHWEFETKDNVFERQGETRSYLEIKHAKYNNKGKYKCVNRFRVTTVLNVEVAGKSIDSTVQNCSKIPYTGKNGLRILPFRDGRYVLFSCPPSTKLIGSTYSRCQEDGTWSNPAPVCKDITVLNCSSVDLSPGLMVRYSGLSKGSIVQFRCFPSTRKLIGSSNSTCLENGTWSNPTPICDGITVLNCSRIPLSSGLEVEYSGLSNGSIAQFKCLPSAGKLIGSSNSTCLENGTWSNPTPICDVPKCSIRDLIDSLPSDVTLDTPNAIDEFSPGSQVLLKCKELVTEEVATALCGEEGRWRMNNLRCVPGCRLDVDPSSILLVEPRKNSYRVGEFVFLSCPPNFQLSTDVERLMCLFGKWSSSLPECVETDYK